MHEEELVSERRLSEHLRAQMETDASSLQEPSPNPCEPTIVIHHHLYPLGVEAE